MKILLILNQNPREIRVLVRLTEHRMKKRVTLLLEENRVREAFEFLRERAEVEAYVPLGSYLDVRADVTLFEDIYCGKDPSYNGLRTVVNNGTGFCR